MRRIFRLLLLVLGAVILLGALLFGAGWWFFHPACDVTPRVVYGQRQGHDLTFEVVRPAQPSGAGVLVMVSGKWKSRPDKFRLWLMSSFLRQGLTLFAVSHRSQPEATIQEIVADVNRAARFVRHHAKNYGIDPQRLGVFGGSSGGHLSLMLATCGGAGDPNAVDPVDRESSAVQAAAVFFPVTDLIDMGPSTENLHDGGPPKSFRKAFGPQAADLKQWQKIGHDLSPINHITKTLPPIFITHGGADTLVPLEQSTRFKQRAAEVGRDVALTVRHGEKHGWLTMIWDGHLIARWLAQQLR